MNTPVYIIAGFLFGGKTTSINELLKRDVLKGNRILLILCEEGEVEIGTQAADDRQIIIRRIHDRINLANEIGKINKLSPYDSVIIEYNGMWPMVELYRSIPEAWTIEAKYSCEEAALIEYYSKNMAGMLEEHIRSCDEVIINRCSDDYDTATVYNLLRQYTKKAVIKFEFVNGEILQYDEECYVPADSSEKTICVDISEFPKLVSTLNRYPEKYRGKVFRLNGQLIRHAEYYSGYLFGCLTLTHSAKDMDFLCLKCDLGDVEIRENDCWICLTAKQDVVDGEPILSALGYSEICPPDSPFVVYV